MCLSDLLLKQKTPKEAKALLVKLKEHYPNTLALYRLLAKAEKQLKQPDQMHLHLADWEFLQGKFDKAKLQLKFAKKYAKKDQTKLEQIKQKQAYFDAIQKKEKQL